MKIGIVTFYRVANYGAMLQAYSLMNVLSGWGMKLFLYDINDVPPKGRLCGVL